MKLIDYGVEWPFVEVTNVCNMHCKFCPSDAHKRPRKFMPEDLFHAAVDQLAELQPLRPIQLQVLGEPLLHPKIFEYIDYCGIRGLNVLLFTNCTRIKENMAEICQRNNIKALVLSLQTPTDNSYQLRGWKTPFPKYIEDIFSSIEYIINNKANQKMRVELHLANTKHLPFRDWAVLEDNAYALSILRDMAATIRRMHDGSDEVDTSSVPVDALDIPETQWWGFEAAPNIYIRFKGFGTFGGLHRPAHYKIIECETPRTCDFMNICVLSNGDITLCCLDVDGEMQIGNIKNMSITEALESQKRKELLMDVTDVACCRRCLGSIVIPESQEEGRARSWWQFWK